MYQNPAFVGVKIHVQKPLFDAFLLSWSNWATKRKASFSLHNGGLSPNNGWLSPNNAGLLSCKRQDGSYPHRHERSDLQEAGRPSSRSRSPYIKKQVVVPPLTIRRIVRHETPYLVYAFGLRDLMYSYTKSRSSGRT